MRAMKWVMATALMCSPLAFTSCSDVKDNPGEQQEETINPERVAFEKQLSVQLQQLAQDVKVESAMESTNAISEFVDNIDLDALKEKIDLFLSKTVAGASVVSMQSLNAQDKQAVATCLKERFKMTDEEIAKLSIFNSIDAQKALNTLRVTFKDGKCDLVNDDKTEGFCIEVVKPDGKTSKMVIKFGPAGDGVSIFATRILKIVPLAVQLPESFDISLTTAKGNVMNGTIALSSKAASRYLSFNKNQWKANVVLNATVNGNKQSIALDASYEEDGHFAVNTSIAASDKQILAMGAKGVKEAYSEEYLDGEELKALKDMGPIFSTCYGILRGLKGKTVKEFHITFGDELVFKGSCSDVAKTLLAMGNLYKLWNTETNPSFNSVDTYTQQLNQYLPFTVTQKSTNITDQAKMVTIMKGIKQQKYQPAVALTFQGEKEPQVMLNNLSATDRENYNKMMGNLNTLIQGCDKLLGSIVEKVQKLGSTIKL